MSADKRDRLFDRLTRREQSSRFAELSVIEESHQDVAPQHMKLDAFLAARERIWVLPRELSLAHGKGESQSQLRLDLGQKFQRAHAPPNLLSAEYL